MKSQINWLTVLSLFGLLLAGFVMVAFQILDLSHGRTNEGIASNLAIAAMLINLVMLPVQLSKAILGGDKKVFLNRARHAMLGLLNFIAAIWIFSG